MTTETAKDVELNNVTEYFRYLDTLRDSGVTNMFGAAPFLQEAFDLDKAEAKKYLMGWMKYFTEGHPEDRAKLYLDGAKVE